MDTPDPEITALLRRWQSGPQTAEDTHFEAIFPQLYEYLRRQAAALYAVNPSHTLQPTALVHEAWLRLANQNTPWQDRSHFFAVAAVIMRRILVDEARARKAEKRGGDLSRTPFHTALIAIEDRGIDMLVMDEALELLAAVSQEQARIVELRFFGGLTQEETAEVLEISPKSVQRGWGLARGFLKKYMAAGA